MTEREKVINDLQDAVNDDWMWQHADYYALTMERAIALLKEPVDTGRKGVGMSGGSLYYFYCDLEDHAGDFDDPELDGLVTDLAKLFHDREWYLSGDTSIDRWIKSRDEFKKKWLIGGKNENSTGNDD